MNLRRFYRHMSSTHSHRKKTETPSPDVEQSSDTPEANKVAEEDASEPIKALEVRCETAEKESKQNYERLLRVSAEFENFKKRSLRESEDFRKFANELLLQELLPVVDNLERAVQSTSSENNASGCVIEGVEMTLKSLMKIFDNFSVKFIDAIGKPFDPNFHQAMMQEESDQHPENTVIRELMKGYLLHDRLLRPSMVVVSKAPAQPVGASESNDGQPPVEPAATPEQ
jgi:molecular chaperone GrpE